jgi:hypothetical protein
MRRIIMLLTVAVLMVAMMAASALPAAATHEPGTCDDVEAAAEGLWGGAVCFEEDLFA